MKLKLIVDFKFDALYTGNLHREPPEFGLVEKLSRSLYWWVEVTGSAKRYTNAQAMIFLYKRCCSKTRNIFYS